MQTQAAPQKIAVVGCGVAGLTAAWLLQRQHQVHLFEKNDYLGGHTRTLKVPSGPDAGTAVDTGFIVMNHRNYPLFTKLLKQLQVPLDASSMTFSFYDQASRYGYSGNRLSSLFPSASYYFRPQHLRLIRDLWRFARIGYRDLNSGFLEDKTLGAYCQQRNFSHEFLQHYLYPMGAAIWSSPVEQMQAFPAQPYLHFLENHGLLRLTNRPQWQVVRGGSRQYVKKLLRSFEIPPQLSAAPQFIRRSDQGVILQHGNGESERFDHVVIGAHADEALQLLADPSPEERANLSPWRYQANSVVLHTDTSLLPPDHKLWSSWNFMRGPGRQQSSPVQVSYYMNRLQNLRTEKDYIVSLNAHSAIDPDKVINRTELSHPLYSFESMATQARLRKFNGARNTWFCGSYFGYGFHEDAVQSAVELAQHFGISLT
jgi:predicted NAD/FAD-binding protein